MTPKERAKNLDSLTSDGEEVEGTAEGGVYIVIHTGDSQA
jgi:hypothetical protein